MLRIVIINDSDDDNAHSVNNDAMMPRNARMMLTIMNDYDDNA